MAKLAEIDTDAIAWDVVGNGPSRDLWEASPRSRPSIGCNLYDRTDLVAIADRQLIERAMAHPGTPAHIKLARPVVIGHNAWEFRSEVSPKRLASVMKVAGLVPKDVTRGRNAGQVAVRWILEKGDREIHLWGFDSLWTGERTTYTDEVFGQKKIEACVKWEWGWDYFAKEYPEARFHVHAPAGSRLRGKHKTMTLVEEGSGG